jgi:4-hydroxybenzoate polyprenyltransferase
VDFIFSLTRKRDQLKNLLIFLPLIISGSTEIKSYFYVIPSLILLGFGTTLAYTINDLFDFSADSLDPNKVHRVFVKYPERKLMGLISSTLAFLLASILYLYFDGSKVIMSTVVIYIFLNILYSFYFKRIGYLEILFIQIFVLSRVYAGVSFTEEATSVYFWFFLSSLVTFIICNKRVSEIMNNSYKILRVTNLKYDVKFLKALGWVSLLLNFLIFCAYVYHLTSHFKNSFILFLFSMIYLTLLMILIKRNYEDKFYLSYKHTVLKIDFVCLSTMFLILLIYIKNNWST